MGFLTRPFLHRFVRVRACVRVCVRAYECLCTHACAPYFAYVHGCLLMWFAVLCVFLCSCVFTCVNACLQIHALTNIISHKAFKVITITNISQPIRALYHNIKY